MRSVLVARLDSEGDVLLSGPAIRAMAAGARELTLLCGPRGRGAAALLPGVDRILVHRAPWIDPEPDPVSATACLDLVARVRALAPDRAVIMTSFHQSPLPLALLLRMAGVPWIGAISEDYPGSLLDLRHRIDDDVHEVERGLSLAAASGFPAAPGDDRRLAVRLPPGTRPPLVEAPYVVVHPGASVPARAPEPAWAAELVEALRAAGRRVVVTGGPGERTLTGLVAGPPRPGVRDLGGRTSLAELAGLLAGADALVVGNTGPAHLAAAVGTPVVSLYAPTVPSVRWRPWGVPHALLELQVPCAGCRARVCPVPGHPCLADVPVATALRALERLAPARPAALAEAGR